MITNLADPISDREVEKILKFNLKEYFRRANIYIADEQYFCPSLKTARKIVKKSGVDRRRFISEKHDCDDFAHLLKGAFIREAYKDGSRKYPFSCGIVWGDRPSHAMNVTIVDDWLGKKRKPSSERYKVYIIEPQSGVFYKPEKRKLDEIYLIVM